MRDLTLIGCTLEGAYLAGSVIEGLRATHPRVFGGAHVGEKEMHATDLWAIRFWIPCFPAHLAAASPTSSDQQGKAAPTTVEVLGVPTTVRHASEYFAEEAVNRGMEALAKGHYWIARERFQEALHSEPDDPYHARLPLALSFLHEGSLARAADVLERDLLATEQLNSISLALYLWCQLCQSATRADFLERERTRLPSESGRDPLDTLEAMCDLLGSQAESGLYANLLLFMRERYRESLAGIEGLRETWPGTYPWLLTFWQAISLAFLEEDERALSTLQMAIEEGLPRCLLLPLRWLKEKQRRPFFFDEFIRPLFVQYRLPYRDSWGQKERKKSEKAAAKPK